MEWERLHIFVFSVTHEQGSKHANHIWNVSCSSCLAENSPIMENIVVFALIRTKQRIVSLVLLAFKSQFDGWWLIPPKFSGQGHNIWKFLGHFFHSPPLITMVILLVIIGTLFRHTHLNNAVPSPGQYILNMHFFIESSQKLLNSIFNSNPNPQYSFKNYSFTRFNNIQYKFSKKVEKIIQNSKLFMWLSNLLGKPVTRLEFSSEQ